MSGGGATLAVRAPDTGEEIGRVPVRGVEEVREMARRGREAARGWRETDLSDRSALLDELRHRIVEEMDGIVETISRETGKSRVDTLVGEIYPACDHLAWIAGHAARVLGPRRFRSLGPGTHRGRVSWEPYGLAGLITPWNFPFAITVGAAAAALAAGNAVLLKPSEYTPYTSLRLKEITDRLLPDADLLQVATGDGRTGRAVVDAPVDVLGFTGSVETGRKVMEGASRHLTPVVLELGGKDAMIVLEDADLERAAAAAAWGGFFHAGQICQSVERLLVHRAVHDRFVDLVLEEVGELTVGGRHEGADLGALTRPEQLEVIEAHVADARERGADVRLGGRRGEGPGTFYEPTVLTGVTPEMQVWREETFGPVLPVVPFGSDEEAVELANRSRFGLDAYVWTRNRARGWDLARRLEAGTVMLNDCLTNYGLPELPFGGVKESGFGRTHGEEGLRAFARPRSEAEPRLRLSREPHWFPGADREEWARALIKLRHGRGLGERIGGVVEALRPGRAEERSEGEGSAGVRPGVGEALGFDEDDPEAGSRDMGGPRPR